MCSGHVCESQNHMPSASQCLALLKLSTTKRARLLKPGGRQPSIDDNPTQPRADGPRSTSGSRVCRLFICFCLSACILQRCIPCLTLVLACSPSFFFFPCFSCDLPHVHRLACAVSFFCCIRETTPPLAKFTGAVPLACPAASGTNSLWSNSRKRTTVAYRLPSNTRTLRSCIIHMTNLMILSR